MAKAEEPVSELMVARESAMYSVDGRQVNIYPGLVVRAANPIRVARPALFEELVPRPVTFAPFLRGRCGHTHA
jgi:hypothetical protein